MTIPANQGSKVKSTMNLKVVTGKIIRSALVQTIVAGVLFSASALDDYVLRFEFPFGIGDLPTTVTRGTRVRSLISIESFVHEKRGLEAVVPYPPELKLCNLAEYKTDGRNELRLPFELRTENDVWYHLIEFEISEQADTGKYMITCVIDSFPDGDELQKLFYVIDKDYARQNVRLKNFVAPADEEGRAIPRQEPNTFVVKDPTSRVMRTFFLPESGHDGDRVSFVLENQGDFPVLLDVRYSIHLAADGTPVDWLDNLRQESGLAERGIPLQVFIKPHSSTQSIITVRSRENRHVPGEYEQRLRVSLFTAQEPFLETTHPLTIQEVNITNTSATGFALIVALLGIVAMIPLRRMLFGKLTSREYILIALYSAIAFSVVSIPATVLSNLLHAVLGPFSFLVTGVFSEVIAYLLIVSLVVLLPRPGVITSFLVVKFFLSAVVLGNLSVLSFLWYPMRAVILELAFYFSGAYDNAGDNQKRFAKMPEAAWAAVVIALADALLSFVSLNMTMFFFRLFYADWYIWMYVVISGFLYTLIAVPLGIRIGTGLRRVVID